jgi:trk system potassium uptake protein TrkH
MDLYEAVAHAFATLPTGGFSTRNRGPAEFDAATQWTIAAFMLLAGMNFALLYAAVVRGRVRTLFRDEELRLYVVIAAIAAASLVAFILRENLHAGEAAVRHGVFQAISIMTGTGFASTNFAAWSALGAVIVVGLMFVGGSAGSTTGSVKVVRHLLIGKILRRELDQTVHPEIVGAVRLNRRPVDERTLRAVIVFVLLYVGIFAIGALALTADAHVARAEVTPFAALAAAAATLGNVGPSFGFAGPFGSYAEFSDFSKIVMIVLMWVGRLEIIPVAVLLTKNYWRT